MPKKSVWTGESNLGVGGSWQTSQRYMADDVWQESANVFTVFNNLTLGNAEHHKPLTRSLLCLTCLSKL